MIRSFIWETHLYSMKQWIIVKIDSIKHTKMHKLLIFSSIPMILTCFMHDYSCSTRSDQSEDNCQFRNCVWDGAWEQCTIQKARFGCKSLSKWIFYYKYLKISISNLYDFSKIYMYLFPFKKSNNYIFVPARKAEQFYLFQIRLKLE